MFKFLGDKIQKEKNKAIFCSENASVFQTLNEIKKDVDNDDKLSERDKSYYQLYNSAFNNFDRFYENNYFNIDFLENAAKNLVDAIELKPSKPKAYLLLAYIYYIIDDISLSVKYMNIAKQLDDKLPQIEKLKDLLNNKL